MIFFLHTSYTFLLFRSGSTHFGIAGWYSSKALDHGMIVS